MERIVHRLMMAAMVAALSILGDAPEDRFRSCGGKWGRYGRHSMEGGVEAPKVESMADWPAMMQIDARNERIKRLVRG